MNETEKWHFLVMFNLYKKIILNLRFILNKFLNMISYRKTLDVY